MMSTGRPPVIDLTDSPVTFNFANDSDPTNNPIAKHMTNPSASQSSKPEQGAPPAQRRVISLVSSDEDEVPLRKRQRKTSASPRQHVDEQNLQSSRIDSHAQEDSGASLSTPGLKIKLPRLPHSNDNNEASPHHQTRLISQNSPSRPYSRTTVSMNATVGADGLQAVAFCSNCNKSFPHGIQMCSLCYSTLSPKKVHLESGTATANPFIEGVQSNAFTSGGSGSSSTAGGNASSAVSKLQSRRAPFDLEGSSSTARAYTNLRPIENKEFNVDDNDNLSPSKMAKFYKLSEEVMKEAKEAHLVDARRRRDDKLNVRPVAERGKMRQSPENSQRRQDTSQNQVEGSNLGVASVQQSERNTALERAKVAAPSRVTAVNEEKVRLQEAKETARQVVERKPVRQQQESRMQEPPLGNHRQIQEHQQRARMTQRAAPRPPSSGSANSVGTRSTTRNSSGSHGSNNQTLAHQNSPEEMGSAIYQARLMEMVQGILGQLARPDLNPRNRHDLLMQLHGLQNSLNQEVGRLARIGTTQGVNRGGGQARAFTPVVRPVAGATTSVADDNPDDNCPVCNVKLTFMPQAASEKHLRVCLGDEPPSPVKVSGKMKQVTTDMTLKTMSKLVGTTWAVSKCKETRDGECGICFEEFEIAVSMATMNCFCVFHEACIKDWWKKKQSCPVHASD